MRDRIADIIWDNCHDGENGQQLDVAADAIIAALPSMIAPLVFRDLNKNAGIYGAFTHGVAYRIKIPAPNRVSWSATDTGLPSWRSVNSEDEAKAAANAHHVAQIIGSFKGAE